MGCGASNVEVYGGEGLADNCLPFSSYLIMLVIIYLALDCSWGICRVVGPGGEARPIVGLLKCSWLNLGASLAGSCRPTEDCILPTINIRKLI
jgi:hypothetical protein